MLRNALGLVIEVREHEALVASVTPHVIERLEATLLPRRQRAPVSGAEAVERAVHGHQGSLECGDGLRQARRVDRGAVAEGALEKRHVLGDGP